MRGWAQHSSSYSTAVACVCFLLGFSNCSTLGIGTGSEEKASQEPAAAERRNFKHGYRATRDDFVDESQEAGSLWASSGQTNFFFTKNKIRNAGDIISLVVGDELYKQMISELRNNFNQDEQADEVALLKGDTKHKLVKTMEKQNQDAAKAKELADNLASSSAAPVKPGANNEIKTGTRAPATSNPATPAVAAPEATNAQQAQLTQEEIEKTVDAIGFPDVDVAAALELKSGDKFMGEILRRYPNGNYQIRVAKSIPYKHGNPKNVALTAIVKATDIAEDTDLIQSANLYETQVDVLQ